MLQAKLARKIVQEVRKLLLEEIIVVDTEGTIMASTNIDRVGHFHEGAFLTCKNKQKLAISKEDEKVLKGVKAGMNLPIFLNQSVVGVIGITGNPSEVSPYAELLKKMTELLIQESFYKDEVDRQNRILEAFLFDWLELREWDTAFLNRAEHIGIDLKLPRLVILAKIQSNSEISHDYSMKWTNQHTNNDLFIRWGNDRIVLLLDAHLNFEKEQLKQKLLDWKDRLTGIENVIFGVGSIVQPEGLKKSFLQAERALHTIQGNKRIIFEDELTLEMVIDDLCEETKNEFIQRTIAPMLQEPDLLKTLKALFEHNYSMKETAVHLHIHINTLHYRLKKMEELTGLNPKMAKDQVILYLGTLF